ncbi:Small-conductance mechanosensitive channel [Halovenus aranensis]|uniref:Small-conductance mechanosensitive channel n=1 Tax=Halovenus aranensis TaxID=890420 RepID=A0A1G8XG90_9EURY|nr:mechanosensitive ion channel family protein [Halovenus aranensis]SDJ89618.1 Small-conductance mechanosensitive channel [Halovenus aranensis]
MLGLLGLEGFAPTVEVQLLGSAVLAGVAFVTVVLVRRLRRQLAERYAPTLVDLVSSLLVVGTLVAATLALADLWGHRSTILEEVGVFRLDERAPEIIVSLCVVVVTQVLSGIAARLLNDLATKQNALTQHQGEVGLRVTQITLWSLAGIVVLGVWSVDLTGLLVGAGFLGIVVGFAARKTLGSLLGGFVLMFSRPFEVGDWIFIDKQSGVVSDITLMSTRIQGFDGEYIVVPNDVVTNKTVSNRSRQGQYRVPVEVGVDYETDIERAQDVMTETAETVVSRYEFARETPAPEVLAQGLDDSAVVLEVAVWVDSPTARRVMRVEDDLIRALKAACTDANIQIPYPQQTLSTRHDAGVEVTDATENE